MGLEEIVKMSQRELKHKVAHNLRRNGYSVTVADGFVYAAGEVPVLLVAHLDTVHQNRVKHIFYTEDKAMMMSPEGIGGDDRAGVYAILKILKKHPCHALFCEDEEVGCQGARRFVNSGIRPDVRYIVELDRRGANDAVFYSCDNPEFTEFVCGFGFQKEYGSCSDISVIAPELGVAGVNLSAGYFNEHTRHELIDFAALEHNIERVCKMIDTPVAENFEYMEWMPRCGQGFSDYETFSFWDMAGCDGETENLKRLMRLPESAYLSIGGQLLESNHRHMMDEQGHIYDYLEDFDMAIRTENAAAYTRAGLPLQFSGRRLENVRVIPFEEAAELLGRVE